MFVRLVSLLSVLGMLAGFFIGSGSIAVSAPVDAGRPGPLVLEDPPQPLVPRQRRTEAEKDHLESLALFAAARAHELREEYAEALRDYQRAFRCNPQSITVAQAILPLAYRLKRYAVAGRYAEKAVDLGHTDPRLLRYLGLRLAEEGLWSQAVVVYDGAVHAGGRGSDDLDSPADILLRMEIGRLCHLMGDYGKAADNFARVSDALEHPKKYQLDDALQKLLLGKADLTYALFGESYLRADRPDAARDAFKKAHQVAPNEGRLEFNLARVHGRREEPAEALKHLEAAFDKRVEGEGMVPYELLGEVLDKLGRKDEWTGRLESLLLREPTNVPLGYALAARYLETEQLAKAELLYRDLIEKHPTLTGYRRLVELYHKTRRPEDLLATLGEAMSKAGSLEALGDQAQAVADDEKLLQSVIATARKRYQDDPKTLDYGMRFAVALLAIEGKQTETAGEFFELAIEADPDQTGELLLVWGVGLLLQDRYDEAAEVFRRAARDKTLSEDASTFNHYLAGALAMDDRIDKAVVAAKKAVSLKKDSPRHLSRLAWVYYRGERNDDAMRLYRELIERFDSDYKSDETREILKEARLVLSNLCVLQSEFDEAEEWLEQVLDEFPGDVGASNDLGYLWADRNEHLGRALRMIRHAVEAEPDNQAYRDSLGWVYYRLGRFHEAVTELEKAAATDSVQSDSEASGDDEPDGVVLDHLGDVYWAAGRADDAKKTWRRAVQALRKAEKTKEARVIEEKIARDR